MDPAQRPGRVLVALLLVTAAIYAPSMSAPFLYEDDNWLRGIAMGWSLPSRALTQHTYAWTVQAVGIVPLWFHAGNLALHLLNGLLVYGVALSLGAPLAGLCAAGLFWLHPLSTSAVAYVAARPDLLMTTGTLLAVWGCLQFGAWRWGVVVLGLLIAGTSKEMGLVAVPLVVLTLAIWRPGTLRGLAVAPLWIALGLACGAMLPTVQRWLTMTPTGGGSAYGAYDFLTLQFTALWRLLTLIAWPVGFSIDHDPVATSPLWRVLAVALTACAVTLAAIAHDLNLRGLLWVLGWVGLAVLPRLVFQTSEFMTEPQMYLLLSGVCVSLGLAAERVCAAQPQECIA